MIEVKGTKTERTENDQHDRYVLKNEGKHSRVPLFLTLFLTSFAFYLKSALSDRQGEPPPEDTETQPSDDNASTPPEIDAGPTSPQEEEKNENARAGKGPGSPALSDHRNAMSYSLMDSPPIEFHRLRLPNSALLKTSSGISVSFHASNDNAWRAQAQKPSDIHLPSGDGNGGKSKPSASGEGEKPANRAPRVSGPITLTDVSGCAVALIGLADLLRGAVDPDGDALTVKNITVSSGTLVQTASGWAYEPAMLGPVTITYQISDGKAFVAQAAQFSVVKAPPIVGTDGDDLLLGSNCADDIDGMAGNDNIDARNGSDTVSGGAGDDNIVGGGGNDTVFAGDGNDVVLGGLGDDQIWGGAGNDRLLGEEGRDTLFGEAGNDTLSGGGGNDMLFGGEGHDMITGDAGEDIIDGEGGDDRLDGGDGNDIVAGRAGIDNVGGDMGDDVLWGGADEDTVTGGAGEDTVIGDLDCAADSYDGGDGIDTLDYSSALMKVVIDLSSGDASGIEIGTDSISNFEIIKTGEGADGIEGGDCDDTLMGSGGDDFISGAAGADHLAGGAGNDILCDGGNADAVLAGEGDDIVEATADASDDDYQGEAGFDTLDYSQAAHGLLIDLIAGTATGFDVGVDTIDGFEMVVGGAGDDVVCIGSSAVIIEGGAGGDTFEFRMTPGETRAEVVHQILDFMVGDRIDVSKYKIFEEAQNGPEERFENIYGEKANGEPLPIRVRHEETDELRQTLIEVDMDKDLHYEMTINLTGHHVLVIVENA